MFKDYHASKDDLEAIEQALSFVIRPKMRFVFSDISKIKNTKIISYDCKHIYVWGVNPIKLEHKIPHNLTIPDEWQSGWWSNIVSKEIEKLLPNETKKKNRFDIPIISGGLLTPFISLQKTQDILENPYITRESYLATIVHEFGHIYWDSFKLWWFSNKEKNINLLKAVKKLYQKKEVVPKIDLLFPQHREVSELYAFCAEYYASTLFWPDHQKSLDRFAEKRLNKLINDENKKDLGKEDSVLEPTRHPHDFAMVFGKLILNKYPHSWPTLLTRVSGLSIQL